MHSKDPEKSNDAFQAEFERILAEAVKNSIAADFTHFVFPAADYSEKNFIPECNFRGATFTQEADFRSTIFTHDAFFSGASFKKDADFIRISFKQETDFSWATFTQIAIFFSASFTQIAHFCGTTFTRNAAFSDAIFKLDADFISATFTQNADFRVATFKQNAHFIGATFTQNANFIYATFTQHADFNLATFADAATFRETKFRYDFSLEPSLIFTDVTIAHPERIEFYNNNLGQALFHNTDVSKIDFTLIQWYDRGRINRYRRNDRLFQWLRFFVLRRRHPWMKRWKLLARITHRRNPRYCLFDEVADPAHTRALKPQKNSPDERNYSLIAETYQQLKRNFDAKGDYWTAGHWHYGEMEMNPYPAVDR
jgi:hypothetical protein